MNKKDTLKKLKEEIFATECYIKNCEFMQEKEKDINFELQIQIYRNTHYKKGLEYAKKILTI